MRDHPIIDSAASLLGVSLLIDTAVHITGKAASGVADELSFGAALLFIGSCLLSHRGLTTRDERYERYGDRFFALALLSRQSSASGFESSSNSGTKPRHRMTNANAAMPGKK